MSLSKGPEIANTSEGQTEKQTNSAPPANPHYNGTGISKAKLQILVPFQLRATRRPSRQHLPVPPKPQIFTEPLLSTVAPFCTILPVEDHSWKGEWDSCPG